MNFSLSQLQAFVVTYETGSFKQAAIKLNKRSQAVAKLVATLEESCEVQLFERHVRKLETTTEGKKLYKLAKNMVLQAGSISNMLKSFEDELPTELVLALDSYVLCDQVIDCYKAILEEIPTLDLEVMIGSTSQVTEWVTSGIADVGLRVSPFTAPDELTLVSAFNFQTCSIASPQAITHGSVVSAQNLRSMTQIVPKFIRQYGHASVHELSDATIISNNGQNMVSMVAANMGWAIVPSYIATEAINNQLVSEFSIDGSQPVSWVSEIIYLDEDKLSLASDIFIQKVIELDGKL